MTFFPSKKRIRRGKKIHGKLFFRNDFSGAGWVWGRNKLFQIHLETAQYSYFCWSGSICSCWPGEWQLLISSLKASSQHPRPCWLSARDRSWQGYFIVYSASRDYRRNRFIIYGRHPEMGGKSQQCSVTTHSSLLVMLMGGEGCCPSFCKQDLLLPTRGRKKIIVTNDNVVDSLVRKWKLYCSTINQPTSFVSNG